MRRYEPYTLRFGRYLWHFKLTPPGKYVFLGLCFSAVGSLTVLIPIYQVFCALITLSVTALIAGFVLRPNVSLIVQLPQKATAGELISGKVTVTNLARRPVYDLMLGLVGLSESIEFVSARQSVPHLRSGESTTIPICLRPLRRGLFELPALRAFSTFPFNLVRSGSSSRSLRPLLVLPAFHRVEGINIPFGSKYQPGGVALTSNIGESPEYIGNREYVPGEPAKRLDFRSWARLAKPVVREFHEEYYCRIALILDTFVPADRKPRPEGFADLEAAVSLAATVADGLTEGEYLIDIFAAGPKLHVFRAGRHTAHFENVLEVLACVEACRQDPFDIVTPALADELGNISTAICIFLDWDQSRQKVARTILEAGCRLKVVLVRDGDTTDSIDEVDCGDCSQYSTAQIRDGELEVL